MAISQEITRLQNAKASLKTSINSKTDQQHQITTETIDDYADFVDSISGSVDTTDLRTVMNMTDINVTSQTPFTDYPQDLYDGYINTLKDRKTLMDNMPKSTSTGSISKGLGIPIYEMKMSKVSSQKTTTGKQLFNKNSTYYGNDTNATVTQLSTGVKLTQGVSGTFKYRYIRLGGSELLGKKLTIHCNISPSASNIGGWLLAYGSYGQMITETVVPAVEVTGTTTVTIADTFPSGATEFHFILYSNRNGTGEVGDYVDYTDLQIEYGEEYTGYEDYTGGLPSPSATYPQTINTITTSVSATISDGTHTNTKTISLGANELVGKGDNLDELIVDANGHCYINKVFTKINSYSGQTITTDYISTKGGLNTGATVYYVSSPTLIDLNQTVDLKLYENSNTITNDKSMGMEIKYIKDTYE